LVCDAQGIYLDYSKNHLTDATMRLLLDLATAAGFACRADTSFRQQHIS
jgi:glucose-6-phosphate isomerase